MKAILFYQHGGPEVLEYADFPTPEPGPNDALVKLEAAALNRLDLWVRNGWPGIKLEYPHIPGADGAGEIVQVGERVTGWSPGDQVVINANLGCGTCVFCLSGQDNKCITWHLLGETVRGTYGEYVVVKGTPITVGPGWRVILSLYSSPPIRPSISSNSFRYWSQPSTT